MTYLYLLTILTSFFGVAMSLGHFAQAYKIFRRKSAKDVSLLMYGIFVLGTISWTLYGVAIVDWTIIISFGVGVIGCLCAFGLALYYR